MSTTKIEWTEATWNPVVGCSIVSPGCTNCYAMKMAARIEAMGNQPRYAGTTKKVNGKAVWTGKLAQAPESTLLEPLRRKKPTMYFVNSMSDLFHEAVPDEWIDKVFAVMALCPQHTFQVLTKRAKRMREYCTDEFVSARIWLASERQAGKAGGRPRDPWPLPNVWLGVSTERQQEADERIPELLQTPAAVRFISAEPLLGLIDLARDNSLIGRRFNSLGEDITPGLLGNNARLDWVIVGGESGSGARPMHPDWARSLRDQCGAAGVPYFFKQWGNWIPGAQAAHLSDADLAEYLVMDVTTKGPNGGTVGNYCFNVGKKVAGRNLDGIEHNAMPGRPG